MQKGKYRVSNIFLAGFAGGRERERETGPRRFGRADGGEEGAGGAEGVERSDGRGWRGDVPADPVPRGVGVSPELPAQLLLSMARRGEAAGGKGALLRHLLPSLFPQKRPSPPLRRPLCGKRRGRAPLFREGAPSSISRGRNSAVFPLYVLVNGGCGLFARPHGQDDGGCAGHGVAPGVDPLAGGEAGLLVGDDAAPPLGL